MVSDLFTERNQFEMMYMTLTELRRVHPPEDEILLQYLVPATCKAAAVLGMVSEGWCRGHPVMVGCWGRSLSLGRLVPNPHSKHETPENSVSTGACPRGPGGVLWWARPGRAPCPSLVRPSRWPTPQESLVCSGHGAHSSAGAVAPLTSCQQGLPPGDHVGTVALCFCPSGGDVSVFFTTWTEGPSFGFSLPSGSELCECRPAFRADAAAQHPLSTVGPPVWGGLRRTRLAAGAGP